MKIATWNVNSINVRMPQLAAWLKAANPDVLCVQETKCVDESFPYQEFHDLGYYSAFFGQKSYNGVAIISRHEPGDVVKGFPDDDEDSQKRLIAATLDGIRIVNTYIPNGSELWSDKFEFKLDWIQKLRHFFDENYKPSEKVLLCGDFNVAAEPADVWNPGAWEGKIHFSKPERAAIHFVKQWGFVDLFRKMNGDIKEFSWWDYRAGAWQRNHGLRIDHIWVSEPLADLCKKCWIDKTPRQLEKPSDHTPVVAEFGL
ncbi:MAG: exodeoxyribonuclease III [Acidobacteria bacterium]|nr:exodeoxyribonuclease III [Acidobacteriota bacterium]